MALLMDLRVESEGWQHICALETVCQHALDAGIFMLGTSENACVDVLLTSDDALAALNQQWRAKAGPTDVLSFPAEPNPQSFMGDIAIAYGMLARDAERDQKTLTAHLSHLLIHGLLHLFGHDHIEDDDAKRMQDLERRALAKLGITDPYSRIDQN